MKNVKTLQVKVKLDDLSKLKLETLSNEHRLVYNYLLDYVKKQHTCDFKTLFQLAKDFRNQNNLTISSKSCQNTARMFIQNVKSFYSLRKKDKTAKFPYKFKSFKYFTSFVHDVNGGNFDKFILEENLIKLKLQNKHTLDIQLPDIVHQTFSKEQLKTVTFYNKNNQFWISFTYQVICPEIIKNKNLLSIDLGLSSIATCFSNVTNSFSIANSRFKKLEKQRRYLQSKVDTLKSGSRKHKKYSRNLKKTNLRKSNKQKDFQHKVSKKIVELCQKNSITNLIIGDIKTKKLSKSKVVNRHLNRSSQNEGTLSRFKTFIVYKAKEVGIDVSLIDEAYTSQENCLTQERNLSSSLDVRQVDICGISIDRDLNSAINIAKRSKATWLSHFDKEELEKVNSAYQEMYYDIHQESLIQKQSCTN